MMDLSMIPIRNPGKARITKTEIVSLKTKTSEIDNPKFSLQRALIQVLRLIRDTLTVLIPIRNTKRCKRSGHVLPKGGWSLGQLPQCGECGKEIRDPLELRRSG